MIRSVSCKKIEKLLCILVSSCLSLLLNLGYAVLYSLKILELKLKIDDFLVTDRVYASVDMDNIGIVEATEYMEDGVSLPDVGKELVSETFTFAGTLYKTGDIHNLHCCRNNPLGIAQAFQNFKSLVRYDGGADVWFDRTEREVCALCLS